MSKPFLESIKDRAAQAKLTIAKASTLPSLDAASASAEAAWRKFGTGNTHIPNPARSEAYDAWNVAAQAAANLRGNIKAAEAVMRECAPYLSAHEDLTATHDSYSKARTTRSAALDEVANLERLIDELNGEIKDLGDKAKQALFAHGQAAIAARLAGQTAPPTPKAVITLNTDLEGRKATLESAESMLASAQARRDQASKTAEESLWLWKHARSNVATIEYQDALASIAPQISIYLAALHGINSYRENIEFEPGREAIDAAAEILSAEAESN